MGAELELEGLLLPPAVSNISAALVGLLFALLILLLVILFTLYRRHQQRRYCRTGLRTLATMEDSALAQLWPLNQLLKQVVNAYQAKDHRHQQLAGQAWYQQLIEHLPRKHHHHVSALKLLADNQRFQADFSASEHVPALRAAAAYWLQHTQLPHRAKLVRHNIRTKPELRGKDA